MCTVKLIFYFEFHLDFAVTFFSIFTGIYIFNKGSVEKQKEKRRMVSRLKDKDPLYY